MEIAIRRIDREDGNGDGSDVTDTYLVTENGKEFSVACRSNRYGRSVILTGHEGSLHIDVDRNRVCRQTVALGGGCGLIINDVVIDGLSPLALQAVIRADEKSRKEGPEL